MFRKNRKLFRHARITFASVFTTIASSNKYRPLYGFKTKGQKALAIARRGEIVLLSGLLCLCLFMPPEADYAGFISPL